MLFNFINVNENNGVLVSYKWNIHETCALVQSYPGSNRGQFETFKCTAGAVSFVFHNKQENIVMLISSVENKKENN